jgi:hypothetical protein
MAREAGMNPQEAANAVTLGLKHNKPLYCKSNGLENGTVR